MFSIGTSKDKEKSAVSCDTLCLEGTYFFKVIKD